MWAIECWGRQRCVWVLKVARKRPLVGRICFRLCSTFSIAAELGRPFPVIGRLQSLPGERNTWLKISVSQPVISARKTSARGIFLNVKKMPVSTMCLWVKNTWHRKELWLLSAFPKWRRWGSFSICVPAALRMKEVNPGIDKKIWFHLMLIEKMACLKYLVPFYQSSHFSPICRSHVTLTDKWEHTGKFNTK